jgi:hypothetical protein
LHGGDVFCCENVRLESGELFGRHVCQAPDGRQQGRLDLAVAGAVAAHAARAALGGAGGRGKGVVGFSVGVAGGGGAVAAVTARRRCDGRPSAARALVPREEPWW